MNNHMVKSREAREYQALVAKALAAHRITPIAKDVAVAVRIDWWRSRKAGDLDKRLGVVLDALQGTIYVSDAQITHLEATRHDGGAGSLVVEIRALGEPQMALQSLATP